MTMRFLKDSYNSAILFFCNRGDTYYTFLMDDWAYEVKVDIDIFQYQEKVKLISQFQRFFLFFNGVLEFASFP